MKPFEPNTFRQHFPLIVNQENLDHLLNTAILTNERLEQTGLVYFDNGATTQKPACVIESYHDFYQAKNANVHRASHGLSAKATAAFEQARETVAHFINANSSKEIIWTKGTTESINLLAATLGKTILQPGDEIFIAVSEHHANIVPWQLIAAQTGAVIKTLPLDANGRIDLNQVEQLLTHKAKIVCCSHVSNVVAKINPISDIIAKAKTVGALTVIDGAQAIAHLPVDVQALDCDFYVFSAHKMYGPTGVGVLYGKQAILEAMPPYQSGGEMIKTVSFTEQTTFNELPFKFEAGTPNIAGVICFAQGIQFIRQYDSAEISAYEQQLTQYCYQALQQIPGVTFIVEQAPDITVIAFTINDHHNHDIASSLDSYGIALRSGHHCAMPLMDYLNISGCLRVSLAPYNTIAEIDYFINVLKKILKQETSVNTTNLEVSATVESDAIVEKFSNIKSWDARHREIMLLGKKLERLDPCYRNQHTLIHGCESLAWVKASTSVTGHYHFQADSDAKIIRGLLVIVLAAFNNKTKQQIQSVDVNSYFESLGLLQHLSPSRGNGALAIVDKIKALSCA
ncbi:hypothetical protein NBRC116592_25060 [Colwellia sp. KU-HH00111]|uniref:SufS family cysteine desulfurase n=1 Tax=Colwellia sp. KU-HH00111 TaxID=3127652 RepID=UPI00310B1F82